MSYALSPRTLLVAALALLAHLGVAVSASAQELLGEESKEEPATLEASAPEAAVPSVESKRLPLPTLSQAADHPFTIEVPVNWGARRNLPAPGMFLGPPSGTPDSHPEMLLIRKSEVSLDAPDEVLANLRAHAEGAEWSLWEAEIRDFGGVRGLWIVREMPPAGFHGRRVSLAVKLPLDDGSLDVAATVPIEHYEALAQRLEFMLQSVRPAKAAAPQALSNPRG